MLGQDLVDAVWLQSGKKQCVIPTRWKGLPLPRQRPDKEELPEGWEAAGFDDGKWRDIRVPGVWEARTCLQAAGGWDRESGNRRPHPNPAACSPPPDNAWLAAAAVGSGSAE